jgi:hypothetical protein
VAQSEVSKMKTLKNISKKILALFIGTAMIGTTLSGAYAQTDFGSYPKGFIGEANEDNTIFVVGEMASASDSLATIDMAESLRMESKSCIQDPGAANDIFVSGDVIEISNPSDLLELGEPIGDVRGVLTEIELDGLKSGTVTSNAGRTNYKQYIRFKSQSNPINSPVVNFTKNDDIDNDVSDFLYIKEGSQITDAFFEYELQFENGLKSDIKNGKLDDLKDESLLILGQVYNIVDTSIDAATGSVKIVMLGGSDFDFLEEGKVKTYIVNGKEYQVEALLIEDVRPGTATFIVNGEITDQLNEGETELLKDGVMIGVSDIVINEAGEAGSGDIVGFYIGATKLELQDTDYTDDVYVQKVRVDNKNIEEAFVKIKGSEIASNEFEISNIDYRLIADPIHGLKHIYVSKGHSVKQYLDEPEGMIGNWDIKYEGLYDTGISLVRLKPSGDDEYRLEFENKAGKIYTVPYVTNENGIFKYGDDDDDFIFGEGAITIDNDPSNDIYNIGQKDYFLLSNMDTAFDKTAYSHIVRYASIDTSNKVLTFDDLAVGTRQFTYELQNSTTSGDGQILGKASLVFGGNTYVAYIRNDTEGASHYPLAIDLDRSGTIATSNEVRITVNGGGIIDLGNHLDSWGYNSTTNSSIGLSMSAETVNFTLRTLSEQFDEDGPTPFGATDEIIGVEIVKRLNNEVGLNTTVGAIGHISLDKPKKNRDNKVGMSYYGVFFDVLDKGGTTDAETLTIEYPLKQRGAKVFVTIGGATIEKVGNKLCTFGDSFHRLMLDTEVQNPEDYNLILLGGPCANNLVAEITSFPTCDEYREMYKEGEAILQLAENGKNIAMLVAGYNAIDTRIAARVISSYKDYKLKGNKVKIRGTLENPIVESD